MEYTENVFTVDTPGSGFCSLLFTYFCIQTFSFPSSILHSLSSLFTPSLTFSPLPHLVIFISRFSYSYFSPFVLSFIHGLLQFLTSLPFLHPLHLTFTLPFLQALPLFHHHSPSSRLDLPPSFLMSLISSPPFRLPHFLFTFPLLPPL